MFPNNDDEEGDIPEKDRNTPYRENLEASLNHQFQR